MDDAAGWRRDPDDPSHERYWDGSGWTSSVRPVAGPLHGTPPGAHPSAPASAVPGHVPQLHRALAESTEDIDVVEDRLADLFERTGRRRPAALPSSVAAPDDATFADLDAALAAEQADEGDEPEQPGSAPNHEQGSSVGRPAKRRLFRRRA
jgi:Protein of unknown function (DUF2510)